MDEFAFHKDQIALWKAAKPVITWGYPLRILSTHNGQNCLYYQFINKCEKKKLNWSHHKTPIQLAVEEGLVDKIYERKTTQEEREQWLQEQKDDCADEITWQQEYCCIAVDEAGAFLSYELIASCYEDCLKPLSQITGDFYLGMDIGRKKDLTRIFTLEKSNSVKYTRTFITLEKMPYRQQREILYKFFRHKNFRRAAIDATGIGNQLAEDAQIDFGKYRIDAVTFTSKVKEELAYDLRREFEDRNIRIPDDEVLTDDLHSLKTVPTNVNGAIKFDVDRSETDGHADGFWGLALANYAAKTSSKGGKPIVKSRPRRNQFRENYKTDFGRFKYDL